MTNRVRRPADVAVCRKALRGEPRRVVAALLEKDGDAYARGRDDFRVALRRLFEQGITSGVVGGAAGCAGGVVHHHWREMGLSAREREKVAPIEGETWGKAPGWRFEVSDLARVRTMTGREVRAVERAGKLWIRYTGSDADPAEKRMFQLATLVLATFRDQPLNMIARHLDGDQRNCRLENLEPDRTIFHKSQGLTYFADVDPEAAQACREILSAADIPTSVIDHAMTGRDFDKTRKGWADADRCIAVLVAADVPSATIAAGFGLLTRMVTLRRERLGIGSAPRVEAKRLPGEVWRKVPGWRAKVSNLGRASGANECLLSGSGKHQRVRIHIYPDDPAGEPKAFTVAGLVLATFRGYPVNVPALYLNGDVTDCRLKNLTVGRHGARRGQKKSDTPWTRKQDNALRRAGSFAEAARLTGHTQAFCRKRMRVLGIELALKAEPRRGISRQLVHRDLTNLGGYVELLQRAGVDDRTINLGLRITAHKRGGFAEAVDARGVCIQTMQDLGRTTQEIADAIGMADATVGMWKVALGLRTQRPEGWRTKAGPIDHRDGEEWRQIEGFTQIVSNMGRVANAHGFLLSPATNNQGRHHLCLWRSDGQRVTRAVRRLVLETFKPELNSRKARYLNGVQTDDRVENLVPYETTGPAAEAIATARGGNLAGVSIGPVTGSVPRTEPLWAQANAIVPRSMEDHVRADLISEMVLMIMEGRATTMKQSFGRARTAYNKLMGVYSETSLDVPLGDDGGSSRIDMLTTDSEFIQTGQVKARRT